MTQAEREYLGWGRVEMRPSVGQAHDVFLNVFQIGDANTPRNGASRTARLVNGASTGAHIGDASNQWSMLARTASDRYELKDTAYSFRSVAPRSRHPMANMARATTFHVTVSSSGPDTKIDVATRPGRQHARHVERSGVLSFEVNGTQVR
jgi:hypothetical protein